MRYGPGHLRELDPEFLVIVQGCGDRLYRDLLKVDLHEIERPGFKVGALGQFGDETPKARWFPLDQLPQMSDEMVARVRAALSDAPAAQFSFGGANVSA